MRDEFVEGGRGSTCPRVEEPDGEGRVDGTVEEGAVFRGPPGPARGRRTEEGADRGGAGAAEGSGGIYYYVVEWDASSLMSWADFRSKVRFCSRPWLWIL